MDLISADVSLVSPHSNATLTMEHLFQDILAVVSTIHNCAEHHCVRVEQTQVRQERQDRLVRQRYVISHVSEHDLLLNLAQFRSAQLLQRYTSAHPHRELSAREAVELGFNEEAHKVDEMP
jgi:hypothetical protein